MRPSYEAESWNSRKRQAHTHPVVDRDRPTWQLTITGQLTFVPKRAPHKVSKSGSNGAAELQTGMRLWVRPGNFSLRPSITSWRVTISLTSISLSFFATSITLILPPAPAALFASSAANSTSSALTLARVTLPSSAYSPILFGGLAQTGLPLTYTIASCLMLSQIIGPSLVGCPQQKTLYPGTLRKLGTPSNLSGNFWIF